MILLVLLPYIHDWMFQHCPDEQLTAWTTNIDSLSSYSMQLQESHQPIYQSSHFTITCCLLLNMLCNIWKNGTLLRTLYYMLAAHKPYMVLLMTGLHSFWMNSYHHIQLLHYLKMDSKNSHFQENTS
jgi:hypothetical protein